MPKKKKPRRCSRFCCAKIEDYFQKILLRLRLRRICNELKIKPYPWQRDFAVGVTGVLEYFPARQSGRTTAVMLRLLLMDMPDHDEAARILACDPEWNPRNVERVVWYAQTYGELYSSCHAKAFVYIRDLEFWKFAGFGKKQKWVRYPDVYRCPVCGALSSCKPCFCLECNAFLPEVWSL